MSAAGRRSNSAATSKSRAKRAPRTASTKAKRAQSLEYNILLTATLCLLAFGAVMVYSASSASSLLQSGGSGTGELIRFVFYGAVGLFLMRVLARDGIARVQSIVAPLLAVSFVLVLAVHIPHVGVSINGARRWIGSGPLQFQPSELLKLALVLYSATLLANRPQRVHDLRELCKPLLTVVGAACLLVVTQPDLGTAMVIAFTTGALLVATGIPARDLAIIAGTVVALVALIAIARPYERARLTSFIDPWAHASGSGFQAVQGQIAIGSGGLFGVGPGQSVQKIFYLPEAQTDFILAVIGEELGVVGVFALLFLYGMIAYAGLRVAKAARSLHSALIAVGTTSLIVSQALLNVFAVLGLAPLTGVPLPLVSYGSSSLIVTLVAMGLLLNVASGASAHVRAVAPKQRRPSRARAADAEAKTGERAASRALADAPPREPARWGREHSAEDDRDSRRRDGRARGSGARGGRRAAR
ncbi:MAG TPA: putative lipid II flippase FtsW [Solirubrobacteraceae bacterium]|jgi:cell division protein FtsW|nr:putative lipid II flippase FtsW [Solirubrobacteraceae bacterium]